MEGKVDRLQGRKKQVEGCRLIRRSQGGGSPHHPRISPSPRPSYPRRQKQSHHELGPVLPDVASRVAGVVQARGGAGWGLLPWWAVHLLQRRRFAASAAVASVVVCSRLRFRVRGSRNCRRRVIVHRCRDGFRAARKRPEIGPGILPLLERIASGSQGGFVPGLGGSEREPGRGSPCASSCSRRVLERGLARRR